ncbi:MAG: DUF2791 family P-loop domain-containing protein [Rhodoferax sp.]|nr:DUF2791 family P-loop domain-containing protein [Rhodoferax sp.]
MKQENLWIGLGASCLTGEFPTTVPPGGTFTSHLTVAFFCASQAARLPLCGASGRWFGPIGRTAPRPAPNRRLHANGGEARSLYTELTKNLATRTKPDGGALPTVVEKFITTTLFAGRPARWANWGLPTAAANRTTFSCRLRFSRPLCSTASGQTGAGC